MLFEESEEGHVKGLNILPGKVVHFPAAAMTTTKRTKTQSTAYGLESGLSGHQASALWEGIAEDARFYFVHSYYVETTDSESIAAKAIILFHLLALCKR
jgi:glutamine amidotransferase